MPIVSPAQITRDPQYSYLTEVGKTVSNNAFFKLHGKPEYDELIYQQAPRFYMKNYLVDYALKNSREVEQRNKVFNWFEYGKWYRQQKVQSVTDNGGLNWTIELNETSRYFHPTDVVDLGVGRGNGIVNVMARVVSVGTNGGNQTITVEVIDTDGVVAADPAVFITKMTVDSQVALSYNSQGECFKYPPSRKFHPDVFSNRTTKLTTKHEICDEARRTISWFITQDGTPYWYDEEQRIKMEEHWQQCDMALLTGQRHDFTDTSFDGNQYEGSGGDGILTYLSNSALGAQYNTASMEEDFNITLEFLSTYSTGTNKWHVFHGPTFGRYMNTNLRDYPVQNYVYGLDTIDSGQKAGVNIAEYQIGANTLCFMEYQPFADPDLFPMNTNSVNYREFAMILNLEAGGIEPQVRYNPAGGGGLLKDWVNIRAGATMAPIGEQVTLDGACYETIITSEVGLKYKGGQSHGYMYR